MPFLPSLVLWEDRKVERQAAEGVGLDTQEEQEEEETDRYVSSCCCCLWATFFLPIS
jgi:hypothetical protein